MKIQEYDVVKSSKKLSEAVPKGALGAVLIVYPSDPEEYEVEFVDEDGDTLAILTVKGSDIFFFSRPNT